MNDETFTASNSIGFWRVSIGMCFVLYRITSYVFGIIDLLCKIQFNSHSKPSISTQEKNDGSVAIFENSRKNGVNILSNCFRNYEDQVFFKTFIVKICTAATNAAGIHSKGCYKFTKSWLQNYFTSLAELFLNGKCSFWTINRDSLCHRSSKLSNCFQKVRRWTKMRSPIRSVRLLPDLDFA